MITAFHAKNFKALRDISLQLGKIHVLIGPNDSGKTSILHGIAALSRSVDMALEQSFLGRWNGCELVWHGNEERTVTLGADLLDANLNQLEYRLTCQFYREGRGALSAGETFEGRNYAAYECQSGTLVNATCTGQASPAALANVSRESLAVMRKECRFIHDQLSGVQYFRWDPRKLALPVAANVGPVQLSLNGFGLAMLLDDILASDRKRFDEMETKFRDVYPQMGSIRLVRQTAFHEPPDELNQLRQMNQGPGKALFFDTGGRKPLVPAAQMSDGVLLVLAYLAILYSPRPPRLLLIEEPENGIHPKLLQRVIEILREIGNSQWGTQIVLTTHSPYAVDLFKPEEVTLCVKRIDGSIELTRMSESSSVRKQISLFSLGEIWTAEGDESLAKKHDGI